MENDEGLSQLLQQWRVDTPLPPGFSDQVWRRIETRELTEPSWVARLRSLSTVLSRPALAASYVTLLLLAGLATGYWQARSANAQADAQLSRRYVQTVDPYQSPHLSAP